MSRELREVAARLDDEIVGLRDELEAEVDRYHAIERASAVERDPDTLLN
jgi:hypothetical protein